MNERREHTAQDLLNVNLDSIVTESKQTQKKRRNIIIIAVVIAIICTIVIAIFTSVGKYGNNDFSDEFAGVNFEMTQDEICRIEQNTFHCTDYEISSSDSMGYTFLKFNNGHIYRFNEDGSLDFVKYTNFKFDDSVLQAFVDKYGEYTYIKKIDSYAWYGTVSGTNCGMYISNYGVDSKMLEMDRE